MAQSDNATEPYPDHAREEDLLHPEEELEVVVHRLVELEDGLDGPVCRRGHTVIRYYYLLLL